MIPSILLPCGVMQSIAVGSLVFHDRIKNTIFSHTRLFVLECNSEGQKVATWGTERTLSMSANFYTSTPVELLYIHDDQYLWYNLNYFYVHIRQQETAIHAKECIIISKKAINKYFHTPRMEKDTFRRSIGLTVYDSFAKAFHSHKRWIEEQT